MLTDGKTTENRERLRSIRVSLLELHKALVDSERASYEKTFGQIRSTNQFLSLVINDPWFAWLHPVSQLIVAMDEALDEKKPLTEAHTQALLKQCRELLAASEDGQGFARHYFDALQRDPNVVFAHANTVRLFRQRPSGTGN